MTHKNGRRGVWRPKAERIVADGLVKPGSMAHKNADEGLETEGERIIADGLGKR